MTDIIEQDALANSPDTGDAVGHDHTHEVVKSIVLTPRMDQTILEKMVTWWKSELKPGIHIVHKDKDPMRYMFLITSNSYEDREKETITTKALEEYEASCYPGEGLYHNDNPLVYWHDRDVVMGEIIAVNLSGPFLIEVAKEIKSPIARILWDVAETTENASVSHEFGYLSKDRDESGVYKRIFKQETTWLPRNELAANGMTYAEVVGMASAASDKWLDDTFERIAGIKNASAKLHAKTGELEKELEAKGITHKAAKPPFPPKDGAAAMADEAVEDMAEDGIEEDAKETASVASLEQAMTIMNQIMGLVMQLVDAQGTFATEGAMMKMFKDMETAMAEQNTVEKATNETLELRLKTMQEKIDALEKRLSQTPKSVQHEKGGSVDDAKAALDAAAKAHQEGQMVESKLFGMVKP